MMTGWVEKLRWWARKKWVSWGVALVLTTPVAIWLLRHGWQDAVSYGDQTRAFELRDVAGMLEQLRSPSTEQRDRAVARIVMAAENPLTSSQVSAIIAAAAALSREDQTLGHDRALINAAGRWLSYVSAEALLEHYPRLSDAARFEALLAVREAPLSNSTQVMLNLLRAHGYPKPPRPVSSLFGTACVTEVELAFTDGSIRGAPDGAADEVRRACERP